MDSQIIRMAELEIDRDQLAAYRALLAEEIAESIAKEPGVLMLQAMAERDHPYKIRILEAYASREAYEAHLMTAHFLHYKQATANMVLSLRLVEMEPVMMQGLSGLA